MLSYLYHPTTMMWSIHLVFAFTLSVRVIMKRPSTGIALAWLLVINAIPIFGAVIYLLIGERRISWSRREGIKQLRSDYSEVIEQAVHAGLLTVDWENMVSWPRAWGDLAGKWWVARLYVAAVMSSSERQRKFFEGSHKISITRIEVC